MMLTRLTTQRHSYNLKLTRAELMAIYLGDLTEHGKMFELIVKEAKRLGDIEGSKGQGESAVRS